MSLFSFLCHYDKKTQYFRMLNDDQLVVSGYACIPGDVFDYKKYIEHSSKPSEDSVLLTSKEVYKELRCRGYDYGASFQGVQEAMSDGSYGKVRYENQWVSFSDSLMHLFILSFRRRDLFLPTFFEYIRCDPEYLRESLEEAKKVSGSPVAEIFFDSTTGIGVTKGLIIKGLKGTPTARRVNSSSLVLEEYIFSPYEEKVCISTARIKDRLKYTELCEKIVRILRDPESKNIDEAQEEVEKWLKFDSTSYNLLKLLGKLLMEKSAMSKEEIIELSREVFREKPFNVMEDFSSQADLSNQQKFLWDIVLENIGSRTCVLTEINETSELFVYDVAKIFSAGGVRSQTTVLRPDHSTSGSQELENCFDVKKLLMTMPDGKISDFVLYTDSRVRFLPSLFRRNLPKLEEVLEALGDSPSLRKGGFVLLKYRSSLSSIEKELLQFLGHQEPDFSDIGGIEDSIKSNGFVEIARKYSEDGQSTLLLLRKTEEISPDDMRVIEIKRNDYSWLEPLKQEIMKASKGTRVWLIASGDPYNGLCGMFNCLRKEPRGNVVRSIFTKHEIPTEQLLKAEILEKDLAVNVIDEASNELGSYRHQRLTSNNYYLTESPDVYLDVVTTGDLTSLHWHQSSINVHLEALSEEERKRKVKVYYSALNFKDVMVATGRVNLQAYPENFLEYGLIGMEYSGIMDGQRVMGLVGGEAIATTLLAGPRLTWPIPETWSMEEACTVPVVYLTCYYALFCRGNLLNGESVLIHAGTGGVGQAAINICLKRGCKVFTTVGTQQKREHLKRLFPTLRDEQIGNTRDTRFEELVLKQTDGRGVDLVLNSLAEEKLEASLRCLSESGRFIEIGKYDLLQDRPIGDDLEIFRRFHFDKLFHF